MHLYVSSSTPLLSKQEHLVVFHAAQAPFPIILHLLGLNCLYLLCCAGIMSVIIIFLLGMNGYLAVTFSTDKLPDYVYAKVLFWIVAAIYCFLIVYLCITPQR